MIRYLAAVMLLSTGCRETPAAVAEPGMLAVEVVSTAVADGALLFTISGGPVDGVTADGVAVTTRTDETGTHLLVTGPIATGVIIRVAVPDVAAAATYVVRLEQVADGQTFALLDPISVELRIGREP